MKRIAFILLAAFSLLLAAAGFAEDASYTVGAPTKALIAEAAASGRLLVQRFAAELDLEDSVGGEEHAADIAAIESLLQGASFYTAGGMTPDGLRLEFSCAYERDEKNAGADLCLLLSREGVSVECSLLEGKRVTAKWETLLAMAGVPQERIDQVTALLNTDFEALAAQIMQILPDLKDQLTAAAAPYAMAVLSFAQSLEVESQDEVPAEGYFPAVDHANSVTVDTDDAAALLDSLADVMAADENLPALAAQYGVPLDLSEPAAALHQAAGSLRSEETESVTLTAEVGYCDAGLPAYFTLVAGSDKSQESFILQLIAESGEGSAVALQMHALTYDGTDYTEVAGADLEIAVDPADQQVFAGSAVLTFLADGETQTIRYELSRAAREPEDGLLGYNFTATESVETVTDGTAMTITENFEGYNKQNAAGGEDSYAEGTVTAAQGGQELVSLSLSVADNIVPDEDYIYSRETTIQLASPAVGLNQFSLYGWSGAAEYYAEAVAGLTVCPLEEMTDDDRQQLMMEGMTGAMTLYQNFLNAAPQEVVEMINRLTAPAEQSEDPAA